MVEVPRTFRLLAELEEGEKEAFVSYGIEGDDQLDIWTAVIMGPERTPYRNNVYSLTIKCPAKYPDEPPIIHFTSKINMTCVDCNGKVLLHKMHSIGQWKKDYKLKYVLFELRNEMMSKDNAKLAQPPEN